MSRATSKKTIKQKKRRLAKTQKRGAEETCFGSLFLKKKSKIKRRTVIFLSLEMTVLDGICTRLSGQTGTIYLLRASHMCPPNERRKKKERKKKKKKKKKKIQKIKRSQKDRHFIVIKTTVLHRVWDKQVQFIYYRLHMCVLLMGGE